MTATLTAPTAATPTTMDGGYEQVKNLIFHQVYKFQRRFGGDIEDLRGEAYLAFAKGHEQYMRGTRRNGDELGGHPYHVEIRRWVWFEMFDSMRTRISRENKVSQTAMGDYDPTDTGSASGFNKVDFLTDLGPDARVAARMVLNPPAVVVEAALAKGGTPRNLRSTVRAHLIDWGWKAARIKAAFEEVTVALG